MRLQQAPGEPVREPEVTLPMRHGRRDLVTDVHATLELVDLLAEPEQALDDRLLADEVRGEQPDHRLELQARPARRFGSEYHWLSAGSQ